MILLFSIIASFIGSLQLGPVNLSVIDAAIHQNRKNAFWVAVGGSLPEFIYCFLAVFAGSFLVNNPFLFKVLKVVIVIILIILSFYYFFKKNKEPNISENKNLHSDNKYLKSFSKGFSMGILNPQLMPFWLSVQVFFNSYSFLIIDEKIDYFFFILGAGLGAFLLLIGIIFTITKYKQVIMKFLSGNLYNKLLGILFLLIGLQQIYLLYHD